MFPHLLFDRLSDVVFPALAGSPHPSLEKQSSNGRVLVLLGHARSNHPTTDHVRPNRNLELYVVKIASHAAASRD